MPPPAMNKVITRCLMGIGAIFLFKWAFLDSSTTLPPGEIAHSGLLERISYGVSLSGQSLDPRRHPFLQSRLGRRDTIPLADEDDATQAALLANPPASSLTGTLDDEGNPIYTERERADLFDTHISQGIKDFWHRFQLPFATNSETLHLDEQVVKGVVDELMAFNGWAAAACSSLTRPFANDRRDDNYKDLIDSNQMYYFALVVHSADHFLIDQMATIIQLSKKLGPNNIFVSLLDYASTDSTPFLCDLADMVFTLLGISFRIKRIPPMTKDPAAAYYPLEESYTRNLALEPLMELYHRRHVKFDKVIWLKGFTCPNDILETLRVSRLNRAAMTCSMDWKEHNGFFIFNDRWRTRDMDGNLFRGSKSTSPIDEAPPRDAASIKRYAQHLPFQVFCCESGVHIIDPSQSFYQGISYRSSIEHGIFNISAAEDGKAPKWSEGPCMDSSQMHFCRDLWMLSAREGVIKDAKKAHERERKGLSRGLSDEMEKIVKNIAPQYAPSDKNSGGYLGYFGRKKYTNSDNNNNAAAAAKDKASDDWDDEEDEDEDEEDNEEGSSGGDTASSSSDDKADSKKKKEEEVVVVPEKKEKQETEAEKEEKKEKAMAAEAAAAALPVEEQHPPEGVDAGAAIKDANGNADEGEEDAAAAVPKKDAKDAGDIAVDAEKEEQFVDPEAMLALEAEKLAQEAAAAAANGANGANGPGKAKKDSQPKKNKKVKRAAAAGGNAKKQNQERADAPAAANPAVQNNKEDAARKKPQPPSVNNPDESDELDNKAPPPVKLPPPSSNTPSSNSPSSGGGGGGSAGSGGASGGGGRAGRALRNSAFEAARIIINPRCVTTYAGVSHTQLALDLFGNTDEDDDSLLSLGGGKGSSSSSSSSSGGNGKNGNKNNILLDDEDEDEDYLSGNALGGLGRGSGRNSNKNDKYALHEFGPAAETFVCQEMRTSGGRSAPKQQRRTGFSIARGLAEGWQPRRR